MLEEPEKKCVISLADRSQSQEWDEFIESTNDGTLFHLRSFLNYHGEKFSEKEYFLQIRRKNKWIAAWPLAVVLNNNNKLCALSPYGGSYGGPALKEVLSLSASREVIKSAIEFVAGLGVQEFKITLAPRACSQVYSETFRFALMEAGFRCSNRDISSLIPLDTKLSEYKHLLDLFPEWERRVRRSQKFEVKVRHDVPASDFWPTLVATFKKHEKIPTHSLEELIWLKRNLPNRVFFSCAYIDEKAVAGICYFVHNNHVINTFYLCQDPEFQATQAQSALLMHGFLWAKSRGYLWIDLGTSSVGMIAYDSIFRFKETLGSVGQFRESYVLEISQ